MNYWEYYGQELKGGNYSNISNMKINVLLFVKTNFKNRL